MANRRSISFARMSISDPLQAGQAGWHGFSLFLTFTSAVFPLGVFSCWDFMEETLIIEEFRIYLSIA
jgi:hypothetical protein